MDGPGVAAVVTVIGICGLLLADRWWRRVKASRARWQAARLVEDRIDAIRTDPAYDSLLARYGGTESEVPGWPGFRRVSQLAHRQETRGAGRSDFVVVTVEVSGSGLPAPVRRTTIVGSPATGAPTT